MAVLVFIGVLLFMQAQQANARADEAHGLRASAEAAQATQQEIAADSAATAVAAQGLAEDQANTAATIQAAAAAANQLATGEAAVVATQVARMEATGAAQATLIEAQYDQIAFLATEETNARMTAVAQAAALATAEAALQVERGRALATLGATFHDGNYPYALLLAVEAYRSGYWQGLYETLNVHPEIAGYLVDPAEAVGALAYSPDGAWLALGDRVGEITLWDVALRQPAEIVWYDAPDEVRALAFSPDGKWLASGGGFGALTVWEVETGQPRRFKLSDSADQLTAIAFSPDGKLLAAAGSISQITLWDVESGQQMATLQENSALPPTGLAFSLDGTVLAATNNGIVFLWNVKEGAAARRFTGNLSDLSRVAFSPDGKSLMATSATSGDIIIWNVRSGEPLHGFTAGEFGNVDAAFSLDGSRVVTTNVIEAMLWDVSAENIQSDLFRLPLANEVDADLSYAPDSLTIAITDGDRAVLWRPEAPVFPNPDLPPSSHAEAACRIAGRNMTLDEWQQAMGETPYRKTCDDLPLHSSVIQAIVGEAFAQSGAGNAAEELYARAVRLLMDSRDAGLANSVCWYGSLYGFAEIVLPVCERALEIMPGATYIVDSRGLARALTGDTEGAIADFQMYLDWTRIYGYYDLLGFKREEWINRLQAGENPFDEATLQALREE
jgi:Tol biopolymer transport system component